MDVSESRREPLQELQEWLVREFAGTVPRPRIEAAANDAFREFEDARIRAFVPVLAWRRARDLLRRAS